MFRNPFRAKSADSHATSEWQALYAEALSAYESKRLDPAVELLDQVIALYPGHPEAHYKRGNALRDLGRLEAALGSYDTAVALSPGFAYAWCNRGAVQQALALYEQALASYDRAIALDPRDALVHSNRGSLLQLMSRPELALESYDRALALAPQWFEIWFHRGNLLKTAGKTSLALASFDEAVKLRPESAEAHYNRGVLLERERQYRPALASYEQALSIHPGFVQAHFNRAGVLRTLGERDGALAAYDRAIASEPGYAEAHANRGVVLQALGRLDAALAGYDQALSIRPDYAEAHFNRGTVLAAKLEWSAALASFDKSVSLRPDYAEAHCERARALVRLDRLQESISSYDRAVAIRPDFAEAQYNKSLALLLLGHYAAGWPLYEWRWQNADQLRLTESAPFAQAPWLGRESISGKTLLVHSEQGYGDTLQFCRFVKSVRDLGATVILEVQSSLVPLLEDLEGAARIIARGDPRPAFDQHCPLLSLPLVLKTTLDTIPAAVPYVRSDPAKAVQWRARLGTTGRLRVGLTWSGNPNQAQDFERSTRLADWIRHLPREIDYVCLQTEIRPGDAETLAVNPWIVRLDESRDFSETAGLCECVDLVISVCTSVAHLSGALGRPTWILLPFIPDWRWLLGREDSPWYPSARLYRQKSAGEWEGVFARVGTDLRTAIVQRSSLSR